MHDARKHDVIVPEIFGIRPSDEGHVNLSVLKVRNASQIFYRALVITKK